jgi:cytosine/adenosine deaminase-related metal-dependent hydrolase
MKIKSEGSPYRLKMLRADWVAPMGLTPAGATASGVTPLGVTASRTLIRDGALLLRNGWIAAVGSATELLEIHPDAQVEDVGSKILLPGLVNAHCHLELSKCPRLESVAPGEFVSWLKNLMKATRIEAAELPASVADNVKEGIRQCLQFGVTAVGDISRQCELSRPLLAASPLRAVSYGEVIAMAQRREFLEPRLAIAINPKGRNDHLSIGVSPHAPYSVENDGYRRCREVARVQNLALATHLAETPFEAEFLKSHTGPLREFWDWLGAWDNHVLKFDGGPIRFARTVGLLDYPTALAHVNYCDDEELAILSRGKASVVYCPRTHAYFQHPPHRWREMLAKGINVAIGTDSCASSPNLNLVDDLRLLHKIAPEMPVDQLWQMATTRAAQAIGMENSVGSLKRGRRADLVAFDAVGENPLKNILESDVLPSGVWIDGK